MAIEEKTELFRLAAEKLKDNKEFFSYVLHKLIEHNPGINHTTMADELGIPTMYNYYSLCLCLYPQDQNATDYYARLKKICLHVKCNVSALQRALKEFFEWERDSIKTVEH